MCHALLQDPKFFQLLKRIDHELAALQATEADNALGRHETVCRKVQNTGLKLLCNIAEGSGAKRKPSARHKARKGTSPGGGTQDRRTVPDGFRE